MRNFPCYVFQGLGARRKISPKFHVKNGVKNGRFHANFTLLVRSADLRPRSLGPATTQNLSERPRSLLLSLGVPSRPSPGSYPGPVFAMCFVLQCFGPIQVPRWGPSRPVLVPSCSRGFLPGSGLDGQKQTSWPLPNLVVKFDGEICSGVLVENASDDFPQQKKLENLLPNFTGSSPPISPRKLRQLHSGNRWRLEV